MRAAVTTAVATCAMLAGVAGAQPQFLMMPDSTNNRLVLFDPFDGSVVDPDFFQLQGGTPLHAMQVGNEIWVSEQLGDRVSRWDFSGNLLGNIGGQFAGGGLDNIRGMGLFNGVVYVSNAGTQNNAPGPSVVMFDTDGNPLGNFSTVGLAPSPFDVLPHQGGLLVSSSSANDDIHRFDLNGNSLGTFHNSGTLNFVEQLAYASNGNILAATFSAPAGVYWLDPDTGDVLNSFVASGTRGVRELGNGNIMWTNSSGAHIYDINTGTSTLVYAGVGRYIDLVIIPAPGTMALLGLAGIAAARRRR